MSEMITMNELGMYEITTEAQFEKEVLMAIKPVLVVFVTEWSGACHIIEPIIERSITEYNGRMKFCCVDVERNKDIAKTYGIQNVPTLLFIKRGMVDDHINGAVSEKILTGKLNRMLSEP